MATLYEIDQAIMSCVDLETGELIDPEQLESLQMERSQKIENIACWIKNLESDALALNAEKAALDKREKAALKKADDLKRWLAYCLQGETFSTARCAVSFRKSVKLEVLEAESIPRELMKETVTLNPDKNAIKDLILHGAEIPGCRLVENMNTQIK